MTDFGTDISALPDLDFRVKSGRDNLVEAIARRLQTPRGGLFYEPNYGLDVRAYLSARMNQATLNELASRIARECRKEPRVAGVRATVTPEGRRGLNIQIELTTAEGPFSLTLAVTDVTVEVLHGDAI